MQDSVQWEWRNMLLRGNRNYHGIIILAVKSWTLSQSVDKKKFSTDFSHKWPYNALLEQQSLGVMLVQGCGWPQELWNVPPRKLLQTRVTIGFGRRSTCPLLRNSSVLKPHRTVTLSQHYHQGPGNGLCRVSSLRITGSQMYSHPRPGSRSHLQLQQNTRLWGTRWLSFHSL